MVWEGGGGRMVVELGAREEIMGRDMEDRTVSDDGESSHLEDDNDTEEVDACDEAKSGEDGHPLGLAEPQLGGAPEDRDHDADLKWFSDQLFHYIMMSCYDKR